VAAAVIENVEIVFNTNDDEGAALGLNLSSFATDEVTQDAKINRRHGVTTVVAASASVMSASTMAASPEGNVATIS